MTLNRLKPGVTLVNLTVADLVHNDECVILEGGLLVVAHWDARLSAFDVGDGVTRSAERIWALREDQ